MSWCECKIRMSRCPYHSSTMMKICTKCRAMMSVRCFKGQQCKKCIESAAQTAASRAEVMKVEAERQARLNAEIDISRDELVSGIVVQPSRQQYRISY